LPIASTPLSTTLGEQKANHAPIAILNNDSSRTVIEYVVEAGDTITLDASESCDLDGDKLSFKWWQYLEPSSNNNTPKRDVPSLTFDSSDAARITVRVPDKQVLRKLGRGAHTNADKHLHVILKVSDGDLVSYRRILSTIKGSRENVAVVDINPAQHDEL